MPNSWQAVRRWHEQEAAGCYGPDWAAARAEAPEHHRRAEAAAAAEDDRWSRARWFEPDEVSLVAVVIVEVVDMCEHLHENACMHRACVCV